MPHASIKEIMPDKIKPLWSGFFVFDKKPWIARNKIPIKSITNTHLGAKWNGYAYPPRQNPYIIAIDIKILPEIVLLEVKAERSVVDI
jgi:hypothetical protein